MTALIIIILFENPLIIIIISLSSSSSIMQIVSPFQCIVIIVQQRERTEMPIRDISKYLLAYQY